MIGTKGTISISSATERSAMAAESPMKSGPADTSVTSVVS